MEVPLPGTVYRPDHPFTAQVLSNAGLVGPGGLGTVQHITFDIAGSGLRIEEGQSIGVLAPGHTPDGRRHKLRLYSVASTRLGDRFDGHTTSLCVRHLTYEIDGQPHEGVCSSYLCRLAPGETVAITGPVGRILLLPDDPAADLLFIATGTGIAPFRAHLRRLFHPEERARRPEEPPFTGRVSLFFGTTQQANLLYCDELQAIQRAHADQIDLICALSREEQAPEGGRLYVQHRIAEQADALLDRLQGPNAFVFLCGLRGMEEGIAATLAAAAQRRDLDWNALFAQLRREKRWRVEVY